MQKRAFLSFVLSFLVSVLMASEAQASTLSDDFNDGNTDGWISVAGYPPGVFGNWRLSDGIVTEDMGRDHFMFVLEEYPLTDQTVEAKVLWHDNGYAGITIWYQDVSNWVHVFYRYHGGVAVLERVDGSEALYEYPNEKWERIWRTMKVDAKSSTGELRVYLDGDYLFTHTVQANTRRSGLSGFNSGNAGGDFDDFRVTSDTLPPLLDVRPWVSGSTINIKSMKEVNVALLATNEFSPLERVDTRTITFGATGDENTLSGCLRKPRDVNKDGLADLVCRFSLKLSGLQCTDKDIVLKGTLKTGVSFESKQSLVIKPCKMSRAR